MPALPAGQHEAIGLHRADHAKVLEEVVHGPTQFEVRPRKGEAEGSVGSEHVSRAFLAEDGAPLSSQVLGRESAFESTRRVPVRTGGWRRQWSRGRRTVLGLQRRILLFLRAAADQHSERAGYDNPKRMDPPASGTPAASGRRSLPDVAMQARWAPHEN